MSLARRKFIPFPCVDTAGPATELLRIMVGVPGRSKGCVTCRKRKKGCDLAVPQCGQCTDRGITCGGYDSDRIFIHQAGGSYRSSRQKEQHAAAQSSAHSMGSSQMVLGKPGRPQLISLMLPEHLMRSAYSEKTIEAFIRLYTPQGYTGATNADTKEFLDMLPLLSIRDEALQLAVLAIGSAALARSTGDQELSRRARGLYGKALVETSVALRSPTRAKSEALLAVPRVMALFEILFGAEADSSQQASSWLSHATGEMAMILARDPEAYSKTDAAHALFVNARGRMIIPAVRTRKASALNSPAWKTLPWKGRPKTPRDILVDIFCGVPELLEASDILNSPATSKTKSATLQLQTLAKCYTLHIQLQDWLTANPTLAHTPSAPDSPIPITFPNIETAILTAQYWVLSLLLYSSLDIASGIPPASDFSTRHADRPHPRMFARYIVRSAAYFFQAWFGVIGATAISFPLGNALMYMKRNMAADARRCLSDLHSVWMRAQL